MAYRAMMVVVLIGVVLMMAVIAGQRLHKPGRNILGAILEQQAAASRGRHVPHWNYSAQQQRRSKEQR